MTLQELLHQALSRHQQGDLSAALADYEAVLAAAPQHPDALHLSGVVLLSLGRAEEALLRIKTAIELHPGQAAYLSNIGVVFKALGRMEEAEAAFRQAIDLNPSLPDAHGQLGLLAVVRGESEQALAYFKKVLDLVPDHPGALENIAGVFITLKRWQEALALLTRLADQGVETPGVRTKLFLTLTNLDRREEANALLIESLQRYPEEPELMAWGLKPLADQWLVDPLLNALPFAHKLIDQGHGGLPIQPLLAIALAEPLERVKTLAATWSAQASGYAQPLNLQQSEPADKGRLVVGYLSSDFHDHATMHLMAGVFRNHNRQRFEIRCYAADGDDGSSYRQNLLDQVDAFVDIRAMSGEVAARHIAADGVQVLVDLKGYTQDSRFDVLAFRPASVQIHYLGYPGTLNSPHIDYFIADPHTAPKGDHAEFTESLIRIPGCYQCTDDQRRVGADPKTRTEWGLPETGFVFAAFNALYKIRPFVLDIWLGLLKDVPGSVLWLFAPEGSTRDRLRAYAEQRDLPASRLIFANRVPVDQHLARVTHVDLALDSWPYGAHTTGADLLWCGVPLLTMSGDRFAARVAAAMLTVSGLGDELVVQSPEAYRQRALALARDPEQLRAVRERTASARFGPHFDTAAKTRALEAAFLAAWQRYQRGLAPADILIEDAEEWLN